MPIIAKRILEERRRRLAEEAEARSRATAAQPEPAAGEITSADDSLDEAADTASNYKVGYKRPPLHSRIKPGQILNPRGAGARKPKSDDELDRQMLLETNYITINGVRRKLTNREIMKRQSLLSAIQKMSRDDIRYWLTLSAKLFPPTERDGLPATEDITATNQAIIDMFAEGIRREHDTSL